MVPPPPARLVIENEPEKSCVIWPEPSVTAFEVLKAVRSKYAVGKLPGNGLELAIPVMVTSMPAADNFVPPRAPVLPSFVAVNALFVPF